MMCVQVLLTLCLAVPSPGGESPRSRDVLTTAGVTGGLVVHVGCGDGTRTAALHAGEGYLVHGLDTSEANVTAARKRVDRLGLAGKVSFAVFDGRHLPYADNLVNLLVAKRLGDVPMAEVMRVLAPRGVAMIGGKKTVKPWPAQIDSWTHFLHGPDNNAMARDEVVGPPEHMQWLAGPKWTRDHHADKGTDPAVRAVVSAAGRLFYRVDLAGTSDRSVPGKWFLTARDAFSGVRLWQRPIKMDTSDRRLQRVWRSMVARPDTLYTPQGAGKPLAAWDAATGRVRHTYPGTEGLQEVILQDGMLYVVVDGGELLALSADRPGVLWRWRPKDKKDAITPVTLAAAGGKVYLKTDSGAWCLSAKAGKVLWHTPLSGPQKNVRLRYPRERLIVADGVVLCSHGGRDPKDLDRDKYEFLGSHPRVKDYDGRLSALSADDGHVLWRGPYFPGLESMPGEMYVSRGEVWLGPDFARPRDLRTGKVLRTRPILERLWTTGHHYRCYPGKATSRYIITAKRGIEMIDIRGENHSRNNWVRGTCRVGVLPCNGLLYAPPHSCGCYMEAKLHGFWALAPARPAKQPKPLAPDDPARLHKGPAFARASAGRPAYGKATAGESQTANAKAQTSSRESQISEERARTAVVRSQISDPTSCWPMYRCDPARSGSAGSEVPTDLSVLWRAKVGGRLSAVTIAGGRVYVARREAHTVCALDVSSGRQVWRFVAGGRVDAPPTLLPGLVLFGSRDGFVYCLRASDGVLVWRFRAARRATLAVAEGQVESVWPVAPSVLVSGGVAYVAAGRSSYLDGGMALYGLDPATGAVRYSRQLASEHTGAMDPPEAATRAKMARRFSQNETDYKTFLAADRSDAFSMHGATPDVLVAQGDSLFLRHICLDRTLTPREDFRPHLMSTADLLDETEHNRSYWLFGTGDFRRTPVAYPWIVSKSLAVPYGLLLTFSDSRVWGVRRVGRAGGYFVFGEPRPKPAPAGRHLGDFAKRTGPLPRTQGAWSVRLDIRPRALARAGDSLLIAGQPVPPPARRGRRGRPVRPVATPAGDKSKGLLRIVSCRDGGVRGRLALPAPPVWDGVSVAAGRVYVATTDGCILCLAAGGD